MKTITQFIKSIILLILFIHSTSIIISAEAQQCTSQIGNALCPGGSPPRIEIASMCADNFATPDIIEFSVNFVASDPDGYFCGFFDTDGDGNANLAACASTVGAEETLYTCNDTQSSLCPGFTVVPSATFSCTANQNIISCSISSSELPVGANLGNVCSITSNNGSDPNGECKSCAIEGGAIKIIKNAYDANGQIIPAGSSPQFSFTVSGGAMSPANVSILGSGNSIVALDIGTYNISESLPAGWSASDASCINNAGNSQGTAGVNTVSSVQLNAGEVIICTFNNNENVGPSLNIQKSASASTYGAVNDIIDYTYTVLNTGNININGISVYDDKICPTSAPCISCTPSDLPPNGSAACGPVSYTITQADLDFGNVTNVAIAKGTHSGSTAIESNTDQEVVTAVQMQNFKVDKDGSFVDGNGNNLADVGENIDYTITVTNTGNVSVNIVSLSDIMIPVINCIPALPALIAPNAQIVCTGSHAITQADIDQTKLVNNATACADLPALTPLCNTGKHSVELPVNSALSIKKTGAFSDTNADTLAQPGETINYNIEVENTGTTTLNDVTVSDPDIFLTCIPAVPAASLAPGAKINCTGSYVLTQTDIDAGYKDNIATASSNQTSNITDDHHEVLPTKPKLNIVKNGTFNDENGDTYAQVGETINFNIHVVNIGNTTLTNVVVNEIQVSDPVTCIPAVPVASLAPGAEIDCNLTYTVTALDIQLGYKYNVAQTGSTELSLLTATSAVILTPPPPTPTATATSTSTATATSTPTETATNTATATSTSTNTATATSTSTTTYTATATNTSTPTNTNTPTNTATNTATETSTSTPTFTPTETSTNTPTNTPTETATNTPTETATNTATSTATATNTATSTATSTGTVTAAPTGTNTTVPTETVAVPTGAPDIVKCDDTNISEQQFVLDGGSLSQRNLITQTLQKLKRTARGKRSALTVLNKLSAALLPEAVNLAEANWKLVWTIPSVVKSCTASPLCVTTDYTSLIAGFSTNNKRLSDILNEVVKNGRKLKLLNKKAAGRITTNGGKLFDINQTTISSIPKSNTTCL